MLIIEDYFMLIDDKALRCQIESIEHNNNDGDRILGVKISRKLLNGYIYIEIRGEGQDDDTVTFNYLQDLNSDRYYHSIEVECSDYSTDTVRDAVRSILKLDKDAIKQEALCH
jgi:transcription antitermination factor NusG